MKFGIAIKYDRKTIRLVIEQVHCDKLNERYKVTARNQSFTLENNRPFIREQKGLKHFPIKWKVVEGGNQHTSVLELIIKAIEAKI